MKLFNYVRNIKKQIDLKKFSFKVIKKKRMIQFYNDLLFEKLKKNWGPLRISNWDMGRLADSWIKMNRVKRQWKVRVIKVERKKVESFCKPPETKRL